MSYQRIDRISEEVRREVDAIIRGELHDPRIRGTFSVTRADVTRDLSYAKIYISILEEADRAPMMAALSPRPSRCPITVTLWGIDRLNPRQPMARAPFTASASLSGGTSQLM